jgi:hypothetical protein
MKKIVHLWDQCGYVREVSRMEVPGFQVEKFWKYKDFGHISRIIRRTEEFAQSFYSKNGTALGFKVSNYMNLNLHYFELQTKFIQSLSKSNCYFEIHDLQLIERFPHLAERFIIHAHGSGIRSIGLHGAITDTTSEVTRFGLQNSPLVLYSTPEMREIVEIYSENSRWIPHPISIKSYGYRGPSLPRRKAIFFPNPWDIGKGAVNILKTLSERNISGEVESYKLLGIDVGQFRNEARDLGIKLVKPASHARHLIRIKSCIGVVSQGYGILGVSDLEALKLNENVFLFPTDDKPWLRAYGIDELIRRNSLDEFLTCPTDTNVSLRNRILEKHSVKNVLSEITAAYNTLP